MDRQGVTYDPLPSALPLIGWCTWPLMYTRNCILEQITNSLKCLGQFIGFLHRVLNFFLRHAGALRPDPHVFLRGGQQNCFFIGFAEQAGNFSPAVRLRYEKKAVNYMALLQFACAVIVWRKLIRVHR